MAFFNSHPPVYIKLPELDTFGGRGLKSDEGFHYEQQTTREFSGAGGGGTTLTTAPTTNNNQDLGGGLTSAQLDQAARMEVEEGAPVTIDYGERLKSGNLVAHKYITSPSKQNTFASVLGEGWGGLGKHGEWEGVVKAWYLGEELVKRFDYTEWYRDSLPSGAILQPNLDGWNWVSVNPSPFLGEFSHQSPNITGQHDHSFSDASPLAILTGDTLACWIFIDPVATPAEIMLQFKVGASDFEHRAYWGSNSIALGTNGTNSRRQINASIPATGQWIRLDIPASQVGLEGQSINGIAFLLFGGAATWGGVIRYKNDKPGNTGYSFQPGILATSVQDVIQTQDPFSWPPGLAYNGSAWVNVRLNADQSEQDRPDGLKCRVKCRRVFDFDSTGAIVGYGYSANPARVAADRVLHFFERRYRNDIPLARQKFRDRIYWPSWVDWRDFCDALIPWDRDGSGSNIFTPRFEAHIAFSGDLSLASALDQITGLSATFWQDSGAKLIFLPPSSQTPIHHFHTGNIVGGGVGISVLDLRRRYNRFIASFRDLDDEFLGAASVEPPDFTPEHFRREEAIARVGEIRTEREFPNMTQSQASRIITYRAQIEFHNPVTYSLIGQADSFKVLAGDYVTISHPEIERPYQLCLVQAIRVRSAEQAADEIGFTLQRIDGPLYDDTAHRPRQEALTL
jgi:hypothetical protein